MQLILLPFPATQHSIIFPSSGHVRSYQGHALDHRVTGLCVCLPHGVARCVKADMGTCCILLALTPVSCAQHAFVGNIRITT